MAAANPGDTVKLSPGIYKETLLLKTGVKVVGGPSTIDATGLDNGITADASVTCCASVEQLSIQNSIFQGIIIDGATGVRIANSAVRDASLVEGTAGIRINAARRVRIENTDVTGGGGVGINVFSSEFLVEHSRIVRNASHGVGIQNGSTAELDANSIQSNAGHGVNIRGGSTAKLENNFVESNAAHGVNITDGSTARLERNIVRNSGDHGVVIGYGSTAKLEENQTTGNRDTGIIVAAGPDLADQRRSSVHLERNVASGNAAGLQILNSDVWSEGDRFDQNAHGVLAGFGASLVATHGSASGNQYNGVWARDAVEYLFCANVDCTLNELAVATVRVSLDHMRMDSNGFTGCFVSPGGRVSIRASSLSGNLRGGSEVGGILVQSGFDYDLGDGVQRHLDISGTVSVRQSRMAANAGWGAAVVGTSTLDLGSSGGGRNSVFGNTHGAVANATNPVATVAAEGNWWGTANAAAIAAMMSGPVDFMPFLSSSPAGISYSAAGDFSSGSNPNGAWSYGFMTGLGGVLTLYAINGATFSSGEVGWFGPFPQYPNAPGYPLVVAQPVPSPAVLDMGPGTNLYTVVRWTAPSSGTWDVVGQFFGTGLTTTDVHVLRGGLRLFDADLNGSNTTSFSFIVTMSTGDALDFAVGPGPGGNADSDPTGFNALVLRHL